MTSAGMIDGGVTIDVGGITKPAAAKAIVALAVKYVAAMNLVGKPVRCVHLRRDQCIALMDAVVSKREKTDPIVVGLTLNSIPLERTRD